MLQSMGSQRVGHDSVTELMFQLRQEYSDLMSHETELSESHDITKAPLILQEVLKKWF